MPKDTKDPVATRGPRGARELGSSPQDPAAARRARQDRAGLGRRPVGARALRREVGVSLPTVKRWLDRYEAGGLAGLEDRPRRGRPRTSITAEVEAEVVRRTLEEDPPSGTHWSTRLMAGAAGLHHGQVGRVWRAHGLKPHLARTFKLPADPAFVEKLRDLVGLYADPPERAVVFAFDEKSRIQALDRTQPGRPMKKGRCGDDDARLQAARDDDAVRGARRGDRRGDPQVSAPSPAPGVPPVHERGGEADRSGP